MSDETIRAIDRFFDVLDKGVETADHVLNRSKQTEDQLKRRAKRREVIDAESVPKPTPQTSKAPATSSSSPTITKKQRFYIVESVDPHSGATLFVVTDGGNARAECTTRELAGQILRALEKKAPP